MQLSSGSAGRLVTETQSRVVAGPFDTAAACDFERSFARDESIPPNDSACEIGKEITNL